MTTRRGKSHVLALAMASMVLAIAPPATALAQDVVEVEEEEEEEEVQEDSLLKDFERLVEGAEVSAGFFDLYTKEGRLYLAVPTDRLGQDFLMDIRVAQGIGAAGLFGGTTPRRFEMDLMAFEQHGEKVFLVQRPHRFGAASDDRAAAASALDPPSSRAPISRRYARTPL